MGFAISMYFFVEEIIWNLYFICFVFLCYGTVKKTKIEKPSDDDPPNGKVLNFSQRSLVSLLCVPPLLFLFLFARPPHHYFFLVYVLIGT